MSGPEDLATQLAVVAARLGDVIERQEKDTARLAEAIESLRRDLATSRADLVTRGEWEQRNRHVDARHQELGREIGTLRTSIETKTAALAGEINAIEAKVEARRAPWWSVAAVAVAVVSLLVTLTPLLAAQP